MKVFTQWGIEAPVVNRCDYAVVCNEAGSPLAVFASPDGQSVSVYLAGWPGFEEALKMSGIRPPKVVIDRKPSTPDASLGPVDLGIPH